MTADATGKVKVVYGEATSGPFKKHKQAFQRLQLLEFLAKETEYTWNLPTVLTLATGECGRVNALYNANTKTVTFCYEMLQYLEEHALKDYSKAQERTQAETVYFGAFLFLFYHELGHALIDLLHLDITGREEDVADQVATSMILGRPPANAKQILSGVLWFFEKSASIVTDDVLADEHLLDKQRYYNVMCWAYGRDTQEYAYLKSSLRGRADRCGEEDKKMGDGLLALFGPHFNSAALNDLYRDRGFDVQHEVPGSNPLPRHPPPPQPTTATPMQFELQIGPRYIHPTYTAFAMIFDGLQLLVTLPGSSSTGRWSWRLFDLPESQWVPLVSVDDSRIPIAIMRNGNRLFAQWLQ